MVISVARAASTQPAQVSSGNGKPTPVSKSWHVDDSRRWCRQGRGLEAITSLRTFLYDNVYTFYKVHNQFTKAQRIIRDLYNYFLENGIVRTRAGRWEYDVGRDAWADEKEAHRRVCDYVAGMTDRYALSVYQHVFLPEPWSVK